MKKLFFVLAVLLIPGLVWAAQAKVTLKGTVPDSKISGDVILTEKNDGIVLEAHIINAPAGKHGFHVHENGSCADVGKAAGGHFNPDNVKHGYLPIDGHQHSHVGDMGSIDIDQSGMGTLKVFMPGLTLEEGKYNVSGRAIVLHEKSDDFGQPTGNAGGRIGCGIIEIEK